jgi:hypothetical protein
VTGCRQAGPAAPADSDLAGCFWVELSRAGVHARAFRTDRSDVAFWKHLFETYEDVAVVRTALEDGADSIIALIATGDFVVEVDEILRDVLSRGTPRVESIQLPEHCRDDWFLSHWGARDARPVSSLPDRD